MPGVIKVVIGNIDERHAGLASGIAMTTLQIGSALGIAVIGGAFYTTLGTQDDIQAYSHAFSNALACNVALLALGGHVVAVAARTKGCPLLNRSLHGNAGSQCPGCLRGPGLLDPSLCGNCSVRVSGQIQFAEDSNCRLSSRPVPLTSSQSSTCRYSFVLGGSCL